MLDILVSVQLSNGGKYFRRERRRHKEVCEFKNFEVLVSKVAECVVDDKTVQDIFDGGLYERTSII